MAIDVAYEGSGSGTGALTVSSWVSVINSD
ncbi:hypothetical protein [Escherichia coli]